MDLFLPQKYKIAKSQRLCSEGTNYKMDQLRLSSKKTINLEDLEDWNLKLKNVYQRILCAPGNRSQTSKKAKKRKSSNLSICSKRKATANLKEKLRNSRKKSSKLLEISSFLRRRSSTFLRLVGFSQKSSL